MSTDQSLGQISRPLQTFSILKKYETKTKASSSHTSLYFDVTFFQYQLSSALKEYEITMSQYMDTAWINLSGMSVDGSYKKIHFIFDLQGYAATMINV